MTSPLDSLTDKEKQTLRLIARGHDAKSASSALHLSVHTINERLRAVRRKLDVTSSREAARMLLDFESERANARPKNLAYNEMGEAKAATLIHPASIIKQGRKPAPWIGGIAVMSALTIALSLVVLSKVGFQEPDAPEQAGDLTAVLAPVDPAPEEAAREWLALVDRSDWQASFDAAGAAFRTPNTVEGWQAASNQVRTPLGAVMTREAVKTQFVNAPPNGFTLVRFLTKFSSGKTAIESVTMEREAGGLKVVGYVID